MCLLTSALLVFVVLCKVSACLFFFFCFDCPLCRTAPLWKAGFWFFIRKSRVKVSHLLLSVCSPGLFRGCKKQLSFPGFQRPCWRWGCDSWTDRQKDSVGQPRHLSLLFTMQCDWQGYRHSPNLQPKQDLTTACSTQSCTTLIAMVACLPSFLYV